MSFASPLQSRLVVIVGMLAALALATFMVARATVLKTDDATTAPVSAPVSHAKPRVTPATPKNHPTPKYHPAKAPVVELNSGLPLPLAKALRREPVVVAALWAPGGGDGTALAEARAGAKAGGAGFVGLNLLFEPHALAVQSLVGPVSDPTVLVVKRPGTVVLRLSGFADSATVAQPARNAGAR